MYRRFIFFVIVLLYRVDLVQQAPPQQQAQAGGFGNTTFNAQAGGQFSLGTGPAIGSRRILKARRPR